MNMNFKKIKLTKTNGLEFVYDVQKVGEDDAVLVKTVAEKTKDQPHPDFTKALQALAQFVAEDEGLKSTEGITVTGVSLFNDETTVIITHTKEILSGTTSRNSGRISVDSENGMDTNKLFKAITKLIREAESAVNGKRAQLQMFPLEEAS